MENRQLLRYRCLTEAAALLESYQLDVLLEEAQVAAKKKFNFIEKAKELWERFKAWFLKTFRKGDVAKEDCVTYDADDIDKKMSWLTRQAQKIKAGKKPDEEVDDTEIKTKKVKKGTPLNVQRVGKWITAAGVAIAAFGTLAFASSKRRKKGSTSTQLAIRGNTGMSAVDNTPSIDPDYIMGPDGNWEPWSRAATSRANEMQGVIKEYVTNYGPARLEGSNTVYSDGVHIAGELPPQQRTSSGAIIEPGMTERLALPAHEEERKGWLYRKQHPKKPKHKNARQKLGKPYRKGLREAIEYLMDFGYTMDEAVDYLIDNGYITLNENIYSDDYGYDFD